MVLGCLQDMTPRVLCNTNIKIREYFLSHAVFKDCQATTRIAVQMANNKLGFCSIMYDAPKYLVILLIFVELIDEWVYIQIDPCMC